MWQPNPRSFNTSNWKRPQVICLKKIKSSVRKPTYPVDIYSFGISNRNTRTRCLICSKLITKQPERRQWRFFIVNLWTYLTSCSSVSMLNSEHVIASWIKEIITSLEQCSYCFSCLNVDFERMNIGYFCNGSYFAKIVSDY